MLRLINIAFTAVCIINLTVSHVFAASPVKPIPDGMRMSPIVMAQPLKVPDIKPEQELSTVTAPVTNIITPMAASTITGSHTDWMAEAGIDPSDYGYVEYIVGHESGWNPCAYYPSQSDCNAYPVNACGLVMQNPCHKIPGDWRDPVAALAWMKGYVGKYGGFAGAYAYWLAHHNY
jgi:hypothetical protein